MITPKPPAKHKTTKTITKENHHFELKQKEVDGSNAKN
jgi:hypothetical protein